MIKYLITFAGMFVFFAIANISYWIYEIKNNYYHKDKKDDEIVEAWKIGWNDRDKQAQKEKEKLQEVHENDRYQDNYRFNAKLKIAESKIEEREKYIQENHEKTLNTENDKMITKDVADQLYKMINEMFDYFRDNVGLSEKLVRQMEKLDEVKEINSIKKEPEEEEK